MKFFPLALMALFLLTGCDGTENEVPSTFIGRYRISDQLVPYPYLIQQKNDSVYFYNSRGDLLDKLEHEGLSSSSKLEFKTSKFKIFRVNKQGFMAYDLKDSLIFRRFRGRPKLKNAAQFEKIASVTNLNVEAIRTSLEDAIWSYDLVADENTTPNTDLDIKQLMHFSADSLSIITSYYYQGLKTVSEFETKAFSVFKVGESCFLSFQKEADNPQPIYQIIAAEDGSIQLKDFSSREIKTITFKKQAMDPTQFLALADEATSYANCFDGYQGEYYFGDDVTFNKGNQYLLDFLNVDLPKTDAASGYVIVHFNINCQAKLGKFGLIQMDRNYQKTSFSKALVSHILKKVSQLEDWPSSQSQLAHLDYQDVHAFLMFKIGNGKITDLCP